MELWFSEDLWDSRSHTARCSTAMLAVLWEQRALSPNVRPMLSRSLALIHLDYYSSILTGANARTTSLFPVAQNACAQFFPHHTMSMWTSMSAEIRDASSGEVFKFKVFKHIFDSKDWFVLLLQRNAFTVFCIFYFFHDWLDLLCFLSSATNDISCG